MELLLGQSLRHGHVYLGCCSCWLAQAKASGGDGVEEEEEKEEMPNMGRRSHSDEVSEYYNNSVFKAATRNRAETAGEFNIYVYIHQKGYPI